MNFNPANYVDVQERINRFWDEHPDGAIVTRLMSPPDDFNQCRYEASVFKQLNDQRPSATGYAFETAGGGGANKTSHEENGETSAIGRALANMGYAKNRNDRPSRQEMDKVARGEPDYESGEVAGPRGGSPTDFASTRGIRSDHPDAVRAKEEMNLPARGRTDGHNTVPPAQSGAVTSWGQFWPIARNAGIENKDVFELRIGPLPSEPNEALRQLNEKLNPNAAAPQQAPQQTRAELPPSTEQPATPRQIAFIRAVAREHGMDDDALTDELENIYNKTLQELDRRDASAFIERLQSRRNVTEIAS